MKKILAVALLVAGTGIIANAQSKKATDSKFSIGPTAGFGWTSLSNFDDSKYKAAGSFGLSAVYSAVEHFGIGLDLKYSFEGAKKDAANNRTDEFDINYVRIPLKAIYFFNKYGDNVRPKLFAGPSFGILSSSKINDVDQKANTESFDVGLIAGGGLNFRLADRTWFSTDVSYTHAFSNAYKKDFYSVDHKNRNVQLNVGVNFGL